jgi:ribosome biogenesis GTPase
MTAFDQDLNLRRLERYLAMTWDAGANPVVLVNKTDLSDRVAELHAEVQAVAMGVPVHAISAKHAEGLAALEAYLTAGTTLVVLGSSGVGKSTLINRLVGHEKLRTNEVREDDHRGRHTTTHRELIALPSGALLIDTPGMRELQLWSAEAGVEEAFDDISTLASECFFADCQHATEPKCAVKRAVEDGRLAPERLANFHKLRAELAALEARQDTLAQQERKKMERAGSRAVRKHYQLNPGKGRL